jgi:prevent-host-death family protein
MGEVASRELRNHTRSLLDRVEAGERITITVDGRPVAELHPIANRSRWMKRSAFVQQILPHQADAGLTRDLAQLRDETTDDLPFR